MLRLCDYLYVRSVHVGRSTRACFVWMRRWLVHCAGVAHRGMLVPGLMACAVLCIKRKKRKKKATQAVGEHVCACVHVRRPSLRAWCCT